jgi:Chaperone of endosialidase
MKLHRLSHRLLLFASAAAIVAVVGGDAFASIPDSAGVIHTCFSGSKGTWRPIDSPTQKCNSGEQLLNIYEKAGADKTFFSVAGAGLEKTGQVATGPITLGIKNAGVVTAMLSGVNDPTGAAVTQDKIAAAAVTQDKIAAAAVTASKLSGVNDVAGPAVTTNKLADSAVTANKIADENVTSNKILNSAVTANKLADNAVTANKISDSAVTANTISDSAVTANKISDSAVTANKLSVSAVTANSIAGDAVTSPAIANGTVANADLVSSSLFVLAGTGLSGGGSVALGGSITLGVADGGIDTTQLHDGAVTTSKVQDGAVTAAKLQDGAVTTLKFAANAKAPDSGALDGLNSTAFMKNADAAGGDLTGTYPNPAIADGKVTTPKLADAAATAAKLSAEGSTAGQVLTSDGTRVFWGPVSTTSDRNLKMNFAPLNPFDILQRLASLPISTWAYKAQPSVRHVGPTAQDFANAFGVGASNRRIAVVDADGVELASIKALYTMVTTQKQQITVQQRQIVALQRQNASFARRLAKLERGSRAHN